MLGKKITTRLTHSLAFVFFCMFLNPTHASAEKNLKEAFDELGSQMFQLTSSNQEQARKMVINNQPLLLSSGVSNLSFQEFVEEHKKNCGSIKPIVSGPTHGKTTIACMPKNSFAKNKPTEKQNNIAPGRLTFLEKNKDSFRYVTLWSDDLNPQNLLNIDQSKETPGSDFKDFPRPTRLLRRFSIVEVGKDYGFAVYSDKIRTPSELSNIYLKSLSKRGFIIKRVSQTSEKRNVFSFVGIKNGQIASVVTHENNGTTYAGISISKQENKTLPKNQ